MTLSPKAKIAVHAVVAAVTSSEGRKLEFALVRYVGYAVLTALGYKHAGTLGL